jgi:hypothetical protein
MSNCLEGATVCPECRCLLFWVDDRRHDLWHTALEERIKALELREHPGGDGGIISFVAQK